MKYGEIEKDCKLIKELYRPDEIEICDGYYVAHLNTPIGNFDFLVGYQKVDKPHSLKLAEEYDSAITKESIKKLRSLK